MALTELTKVTGPGIHTLSNVLSHNIKSSGIITATKFSGPLDSIGGNFAGVITATNGVFSGNVTIGGTLTYEDVTNIDSVGIITAPAVDVDDFVSVGSNIHLGNAGVITATSFVGSGAALTGIDATSIKDSGGNVKIQAQASGAIHTGVSTFSDTVKIGAGVTIEGNGQATFVGVVTHSNHIDLPDDKIIRLGVKNTTPNGELTIRHSSTDVNYIQSPTQRTLQILGNGGVLMRGGGNENIAYFLQSSVKLYQNQGLKLETTSKGIEVGAGVTIETNGQANFAGIVTFSHTGANQLVIKDSDTSGDAAHMRISFQDSGGTEKFFVGNSNSNGWLYLGSPSGQNNNIAFRVNGNDKFQVNGAGAYVNGDLTVNGTADILDSIIHTGDTNTKIRFPANDTVTIETAGSERLRIGSNGYVNIGTGSAEQQLTVQNSAQHSLIRVIGNASSDTGVDFGDPADSDIGRIRYSNNGDYMTFRVNNINSVRFDSSGRVQIGGGDTPSQVGDGRLIVYSTDRLHPAIKCAGMSNNYANGWTLLGDNYTATESHVNLGVSYSGAGLVLSRACKVSGSSDDAYVSSMAQYSTRPCALKMDHDGAISFHTTETSATRPVDNAVSLTEVFKVDRVGNIYQRISDRNLYLGASNQLRLGVQGNGDPNIEAVSGDLKLMKAGSSIMQLRSDGFQMYEGIYPGVNNSKDLGKSSYRWANIYTQDLQLSNEAKKDTGGNDVDGSWGDWTLQEGEHKVYMINNRTGKKYSLKMEEE